MSSAPGPGAPWRRRSGRARRCKNVRRAAAGPGARPTSASRHGGRPQAAAGTRSGRARRPSSSASHGRRPLRAVVGHVAHRDAGRRTRPDRPCRSRRRPAPRSGNARAGPRRTGRSAPRDRRSARRRRASARPGCDRRGARDGRRAQHPGRAPRARSGHRPRTGRRAAGSAWLSRGNAWCFREREPIRRHPRVQMPASASCKFPAPVRARRGGAAVDGARAVQASLDRPALPARRDQLLIDRGQPRHYPREHPTLCFCCLFAAVKRNFRRRS